jgi:hypothetical protein
MLVIRSAQMEAFKEAALRSFEGEMVRHLYEFAPSHCDGIGEENVRSVVRIGVRRSAACGFTRRGPVRFYLELMFLLGSHFDTDPQLPTWATDILRTGTVDDQMQRADRLHDGMLGYLREVVGPSSAYARRAVEKFRHATTQPLPLTTDTFVSGVLALMQQIYPERYAYVGAGALTSLISEGTSAAKARSLSSIRGAALCSLMMFELGHGCFDDPLYPWIPRASAEVSTADPDQATERLERRVVRYIEFILKRLQQA